MEIDLLSLLGSYCFPIVACIFMFKYTTTSNEKYRTDIIDMNNKHHEEMLLFQKSIDNNTNAINRFCERLEEIEKGEEKNET